MIVPSIAQASYSSQSHIAIEPIQRLMNTSAQKEDCALSQKDSSGTDVIHSEIQVTQDT
jgi:PIN domain nuclease of toxin-antitoxin system